VFKRGVSTDHVCHAPNLILGQSQSVQAEVKMVAFVGAVQGSWRRRLNRALSDSTMEEELVGFTFTHLSRAGDSRFSES
jgi:hypothetical protein